MFFKTIIFFAILFLPECKSKTIKKINSPSILRLTYDVVWFPLPEEIFINSETNSGQGISFTINLSSAILILSSFPVENQNLFKYHYTETENSTIKKTELKSTQITDNNRNELFIDKMKNNTNAYILYLSPNKDTVYLRWQWTYNGKRILIESVSKSKLSLEKQISLFKNIIKSGLKVYYER